MSNPIVSDFYRNSQQSIVNDRKIYKITPFVQAFVRCSNFYLVFLLYYSRVLTKMIGLSD